MIRKVRIRRAWFGMEVRENENEGIKGRTKFRIVGIGPFAGSVGGPGAPNARVVGDLESLEDTAGFSHFLAA
jgi:hypothetical protein